MPVPCASNSTSLCCMKFQKGTKYHASNFDFLGSPFQVGYETTGYSTSLILWNNSTLQPKLSPHLLDAMNLISNTMPHVKSTAAATPVYLASRVFSGPDPSLVLPTHHQLIVPFSEASQRSCASSQLLEADPLFNDIYNCLIAIIRPRRAFGTWRLLHDILSSLWHGGARDCDSPYVGVSPREQIPKL